jgi:hypothetical protein
LPDKFSEVELAHAKQQVEKLTLGETP